MLVALLTIILLSGGTSGIFDYFDQAGDRAKDVIQDEGRRDAALDYFKAMKDRSKEFDKSLKPMAKALETELSGHQDASSAIDATWEQFFALNNEFAEDMIDLRFELKTQVNREEWEQLFPAN